MKGQKALFSRASDEWETPQPFYDLLNKEFKFQLDPCCTINNQKAPTGMGLMPPCGYGDCERLGKWNHITACGLETDWYENGYKRVFVNPPYSQITVFMCKAETESKKGAIVACLIPSRTDTVQWHKYCMQAYEIRFVKGRLKFQNRTLPKEKITSATFPSSVIIFDEKKKQAALAKQKPEYVCQMWVKRWHPILSAMERG